MIARLIKMIMGGASDEQFAHFSLDADYEGLERQMQLCGAQAYHFYQPQMGVIAAAPADDAVAYDADLESQKCVLDWAREHGFKVLGAEELQQLLKNMEGHDEAKL